MLLYLTRAIKRRDYQRIGPETSLRVRSAELLASYNGTATPESQWDQKLVIDMQQILLKSYADVTPFNRDLNQRRYEFRASASLHLLRSLIWVLGVTTIILMADKLSYFPKVAP